MMSFLHDDDLLTGQLLASDTIVLTPDQIDWAIGLSRRAASETEQWQTYLNGLALLGLQAWLQKRSPELALISNWLSPTSDPSFQPAQPPTNSPEPRFTAESVCWVQVANSHLYLLPNDGLEDDWITVPRINFGPEQNVSQNPEQIDFYVLVEVLEELSEVRVQGYLSQTCLEAVEFQEAAQPERLAETGHSEVLYSETAYSPEAARVERLLPLRAFSLDPDALLLHLRTEHQLNSALAAAPKSAVAANPVAPPLIIPPRVNVGLWLNNQLDALAEALSWVLLSPAEVDLSGALRGQSDTRDLDVVIRSLKRERDLVIPGDARVAYRDITLEGLAARLYALVWVSGDRARWSLLLILGAEPGFPPPRGLGLRVMAAEQLLSDKQLEQNPYLYVQVAGERDEQIQVTLTAPNGAILPISDFFLDA
ncbi:MAG: DUF1822 family protein [Elainella sp.]